MAKEIVTIQETIKAPIGETFDWFYKSENFIASPIVFRSSWRQGSQWQVGAKRDIIMVAGWYAEEITEVEAQRFIRYRVNRSLPAVKQEFTEIAFEAVSAGETKVTWTIEIEVPIPPGQKALNRLAGKMAGTLYRTILTAGKRVLEVS